jgi:hypothetical protein
MCIFGNDLWKALLTQKFPSLQRYRLFAASGYGPIRKLYSNIPLREQAAVVYGVVRSQLSGHNPGHQKLPPLAAEWLTRYDAGYDVSRWYTTARDQAS